MAFVEQTIDIRVPLNVVYRQWTQYESYPYFMEGIKAVQPLSEIRLLWLGEIGGNECEWFTETTLQIPNQLLGWRSTSGLSHIVTVRFLRLSDDGTRIVHQISAEDYGQESESVTAHMNRRLKHTLVRFREFIEDQNYSADLWRSEVERSLVKLWRSDITQSRRA